MNSWIQLAFTLTQSIFYHHVFTLSQLHLPLSLSPCFSPSFFPSAEQPQREWDVGCMVIESVLIGLQRGLQEANGGRGIRAVPQTASLSSHFLQENILAVLLGFRKGRNVTFWDNISTSCSLLLVLTVGPGRASFSIGCIIWLTGCIIWAGLTVIFHCDVATEDWEAMSVRQAREALM